MANWFKYKIIVLITLPIILSATSVNLTKKWGFYGHKRINRMATFTLPPEMFGFFKEHIEFLTDHAVDPDQRRYAMEGEAQCHYIDLDHYYKAGEDTFNIVPRKWKDAIKKYTEDTLQTYGIVPWHIETMKFRLQKAFENKNVDLILKYASEIGHYVADAHVPLHTTENYNGIATGQRGIHGLWESRLVEINAEDYDYFVGKGQYIKNINEFAWNAVIGSHRALDSVFRMEKEVTQDFPADKKYSFEQRGNMTISVYSYDFCQEYHKRMNGMVERRMKAAIIATGSIWYTAWVDAGQPDLKSLQNVQPSAELLEELKKLNEDFHNNEHKGRICD